jgi:hypothetical protein
MIPPLLDRLRLTFALQHLVTDVRIINDARSKSLSTARINWHPQVKYIDFWNWCIQHASQPHVQMQFRTSNDFTATRVLIKEKGGIKIGFPVTYLAVLGKSPTYVQWV